MLNRKELEESLDYILRQEVERILATVPYAGHLTDENHELDEEYYLRHRIETIKRIRMTSKTDALALAHMVDEDYEAARLWGRYTAQELNHDLLFMKDLRQHGYTDEMVAAIEPFPSTMAMIDYLKNQIESIGSLPALAYSIFTEWNSERASAKVVEKAEKKYSKSFVSGSKAHVVTDETQDHYKIMLDIAHTLLAKKGDEKILIMLLKDISVFMGDYFDELYEQTVVQGQLKSLAGV
ncbi:MAG: hypothetical protein F6K56_40395 [Moorea sp. SIO3G5]|nr:hypothetical protein [Moorena sp. SIO3G5]